MGTSVSPCSTGAGGGISGLNTDRSGDGVAPDPVAQNPW